jgi:hypothetical protein
MVLTVKDYLWAVSGLVEGLRVMELGFQVIGGTIWN